MDRAPSFLITIDTEGDNLWAAPRTVTTKNASYLPRFQSLCERHGFMPTWLTNHEMAVSGPFVEFGRDVIKRNRGEIGMHLHAWDSPPLVPLTADDRRYHPYLIEFPESAMRDKIRFLTELLEDRFERKMVSHRAGRWAFNGSYARLLQQHGYLVDCSVTPHRSWASHRGDPNGCGGTDYTHYPARPYLMNLEHIGRPGNSSLLEVPVTIVKTRAATLNRAVQWAVPVVRRAVRGLFPPLVWLRPTGRNLPAMLGILRKARRERWPCVEFVLHSSELMPGGSPTFHSPNDVERLYDHLEILFSKASAGFVGETLGQFHATWTSERGLPTPSRQETFPPKPHIGAAKNGWGPEGVRLSSGGISRK